MEIIVYILLYSSSPFSNKRHGLELPLLYFVRSTGESGDRTFFTAQTGPGTKHPHLVARRKLMNLRLAMVFLLLAAPAFGGTPPAPDQTSGPTTLAIVNATVVDVRTGKETPDTVVIIRGDRIERVGTSQEVPVPAQAQVVDAAGKWVIPGLMDMHAHAGNSHEAPVNLFDAPRVNSGIPFAHNEDLRLDGPMS